MTPRHLLLACALVAGVVSTAAAAQSRSETVILGELRQNQESLARLAAAVGQLADQMRALDKRITDSEGATIKGLADQRIQITALAGTVQTMREKLDDSALRTTQSTQEIAAVREGVRMLTDQVNILIGLLQPPVGTESAQGGAPGAPGPVRMKPSPESLMNPAMADRFAGRYNLAIDGFEELIKTWPDSIHAAKAQYFIGEVYKESKRPKDAIAAYDKVIANYKDSEYARDAYLMKGATYLDDLKQPGNAAETWRALVKQHPGSNQANLAQERLKAIKGGE